VQENVLPIFYMDSDFFLKKIGGFCTSRLYCILGFDPAWF